MKKIAHANIDKIEQLVPEVKNQRNKQIVKKRKKKKEYGKRHKNYCLNKANS